MYLRTINARVVYRVCYCALSEVINDTRVKIKWFGKSNNEPTPVSGTDTVGYEIIQRTIRQVFPGVLVAPAWCVGGTNSEYYVGLTNNIYRFSPLNLRREDMKRLDGIKRTYIGKGLRREREILLSADKQLRTVTLYAILDRNRIIYKTRRCVCSRPSVRRFCERLIGFILFSDPSSPASKRCPKLPLAVAQSGRT